MTDKKQKPCRDAFEEWWENTDEDMYGTKHAAWSAFQAAWNRRRVNATQANYESLWAKHIALRTLLDAVREVRDKLHRGGYAEHVSSRGIADTLTRIIDQHECPPNTDMPISARKKKS